MEISSSTRKHLRELRAIRKQYEQISETKEIGAGPGEKQPEEADMIELVNAVRVAKQWYELLIMEIETLKELRE